jgi:hypothetical protein
MMLHDRCVGPKKLGGKSLCLEKRPRVAFCAQKPIPAMLLAC